MVILVKPYKGVGYKGPDQSGMDNMGYRHLIVCVGSFIKLIHISLLSLRVNGFIENYVIHFNYVAIVIAQ